MKSFVTLLRREFWENRGAFMTAPLAITGCLVLLILLVIAGAAILVNEVDGEKFLWSKAMDGLANADLTALDAEWDGLLMAFGGLFNAILFFVILFYLLGSLHDDRKDRSILFWKSLPISDTRTVLSKLVSATVIAPTLWIGAIATFHVLFMLIATVLAWNAGLGAWDYVWGPADPVTIWLLLFLGYFVQGFWMLPVWGWLLLVSAFARSKPFLWATVPWVIAIIFQSWLNATRYLRFDNQIAEIIGKRLLGGVLPIGIQINGDEGVSVGTLTIEDGEVREVPVDILGGLQRFGDADMFWGIIVGVAFLAGAIYIRRYRDEA